MTKEIIESTLKGIIYPGINKDIVTLGIVKSINISDQAVSVELDMRSEDTEAIKTVEYTREISASSQI